MSPKQFRLLIDTLGADVAKWPPDQRAAALALLSESADAQDVLRRAVAFDGQLRTPEPGLSPDRRASLVDNIMKRLDDDRDP
ncbi:hypothetical protein [Roseospira visakhapatnamensis]|uniref:Uncharacterized protein n=1 Tax=Roseospira visakhapatnamensis TaxID=390880 RepID=A0A7W6RBU7_9PROT|nr:hypothetical protein [Roseospira visakhapatnamensis]MBB4265512.1 hypothetical protein [Roseospira visakhapatnamensis]